MAAEPKQHEFVVCRTPEGKVLATVEIFAPEGSEALVGESHPLVLLSPQEALQNGEERLQLRERGRYEYRLIPAPGVRRDLQLLRQSGVSPSRVQSEDGDRGLIEPQDHCGLLPLTVICRGDLTERPLARGLVEVRSLKIGYRDHYRGMLSYIAEKCAGLVLNYRAPTRLRLATLWQRDARFMEQQLEFLRCTLESPAFHAAVDEVLRNPHRRLENEREEQPTSRPFKPDKEFARQIGVATQRIPVPIAHPLHPAIQSLPARVAVQARTDLLDTAENRFVKMVLTEFRDFLTAIATHLAQQVKDGNQAGAERLLKEAERLRGALGMQLSRGFLPDLIPPSMLPLGSPVLQRKAGYRELLRYWLQFHAGAQLAWDGGIEVFEAGARNVATLYEYWLFFQLETLFRKRFTCDQPLHALIVNRSQVPPQLELKRGVALRTPVAGSWSKTAGRHLRAEFHFNRKYMPLADRDQTGSWTRGVQPDYSISIWPAEFSQQEAEQNELIVHVHFDAKYRVERVGEILGDVADDEGFKTVKGGNEGARTIAKYGDLLKMHAYRDAIRRTAGSYVLYPGQPGGLQMFQGFHEVLPGLGAFAIRPDKDGRPEGMDALAEFLDRVIEHLANRTTARERASYHVAASYTVKENPVPYGSLHLAEWDIYGKEYRALPPAEDMVLVGWYENTAQLELAQAENGFMYVRLGRRAGALYVHPNLARVRRVVMKSHNGVVAPGFLNLRELGFRVFTRKQLRAELQQRASSQGIAGWEASAGEDEEEHIYALFRTTRDANSAGQQWRGDVLMALIERFESDRRNKPVENVGMTSAYPRILPLREVLKARA